MKYVVFCIGLCCVLGFSHVTAQQKINLNLVEKILMEETPTKEDLEKAVENVNLAIKKEKYYQKSKTWYLRGKAYEKLYYADYTIKNMYKRSALSAAVASYVNAKRLELNSVYNLKAERELESLWGNELTTAVNYYQENKLFGAVSHFENLTIIKPADTKGYIYAASAATELKDYPTAIKNFKSLARLNPREDIYVNIIRLQKDFRYDYQSAQETINEAKRTLGQNNLTILKNEVDLLITQKKNQEAITVLDKTIALEPGNAVLHLRRGLLYDQIYSDEVVKTNPDENLLQEYQKKAISSYKKTTELDPDNVTAYFNYSVLLSNKANRYFNEVNSLSMQEYEEKGEALKTKGMELLKTAVIPMEKALELDPDDVDTLFALQNYYSALGENEKFFRVKERLKKLGY